MTADRPTAERLLQAFDLATEAQRAALAALLAAVVTEPPPDRELVTIAAAARRLGVSRSTATRWADAGDLATVLIDGRRWVTSAELDRLGKR